MSCPPAPPAFETALDDAVLDVALDATPEDALVLDAAEALDPDEAFEAPDAVFDVPDTAPDAAEPAEETPDAAEDTFDDALEDDALDDEALDMPGRLAAKAWNAWLRPDKVTLLLTTAPTCPLAAA